jgi:uncharacterized damage-inducible protein DinB
VEVLQVTQVQSLVNQWLRHRKVLLDLLDRIPEGKTQFKPWDGAMSLGDLAVHMATSADWFVNSVKNGRFERPGAKPKPESMEEVRKLVHEYTDKTALEFTLLTDDQLERTVEANAVFGFDAPGKIFIHSMREHEIHHKGQLFVYARMVGVEQLPFFISRD